MLGSITILFAVTFFSGGLVYLMPNWKGENFNLTLIFAGSYLFGITIIHILPELFSYRASNEFIGGMILAGFFLQLILEYFTAGVEHGHVHKHNQKHSLVSSVSLMVALCFHAFLEGTLLAHPITLHEHHPSASLLLGITVHKIPVSFALMSVLTCHYSSKVKPIIFLIIFSLASPLGLIISESLSKANIISENVFLILFAIVSGSFLKISTTIFFESAPEHKSNLNKIIVSIAAALLALLADNMF
ncbi:MAG: ZIP family metal transporter [Bacteroidetes bacterium]|nr:ZIP family metal transporter [Bacteroidota bacterium]MDA1119013.1 ZIP family metal transporter [Bacteroidota bacterium]